MILKNGKVLTTVARMPFVALNHARAGEVNGMTKKMRQRHDGPCLTNLRSYSACSGAGNYDDEMVFAIRLGTPAVYNKSRTFKLRI